MEFGIDTGLYELATDASYTIVVKHDILYTRGLDPVNVGCRYGS